MKPLARILLFLRERRIRKTKEQLAYWAGKSDILRNLCQGDHYTSERQNLAEAYANQRKYEARLAYLQSNNPNINQHE